MYSFDIVLLEICSGEDFLGWKAQWMNTSIWAVSQAKVGKGRIQTGDLWIMRPNTTFRPAGETYRREQNLKKIIYVQ